MLRPVLHLVLHVAAPALVARLAWRAHWLRAWLVMLATMVVDLDHVLARPTYDAHRCSIGVHPLHSYPALVAYLLLAVWPRTRLLGVGLLLHMALDVIDCVWMRL
ncbi:MAG: hypothetical protein HY906_28185 [Deltaproteobacteria bacterium]|nr:hypothetical protein [Deltaproteobacteria bacterium]